MIPKELNKVKNFFTQNSSLYYTDISGNFFINEKLIIEGDFRVRSLLDDKIILFTNDNLNTIIYSETGDIINKFKGIYLGVIGKLNHSLYLSNLNDGKTIKAVLYDFKQFKIIKEYKKLSLKGFKLLIKNDFLIYNDRKKISLLTFENEVIWQHSFSDLIGQEDAYLLSEVIEYTGRIYFVLKTNIGDKMGVFCVDVSTGKIIDFFEGNFFHLFKDSDYLYTTEFKNILCRINLKTNSIEKWNVSELLKDNGFHTINDPRCVAKGNKFYFTQVYGNKIPKLGVLDFETKTMLYKYDFKTTKGLIGSIKVSNNRIFVHTSDNTLHIFENELIDI